MTEIFKDLFSNNGKRLTPVGKLEMVTIMLLVVLLFVLLVLGAIALVWQLILFVVPLIYPPTLPWLVKLGFGGFLGLWVLCNMAYNFVIYPIIKSFKG